MTFWDWLWKTQQSLESKLTRFLGILVAYWSVAQDSPSMQALIPLKYKPFVGIAMGALIFWRGQSTSDTYQLAKKIVAVNPDPPLVTDKQAIKTGLTPTSTILQQPAISPVPSQEIPK